MVAGGGGGNESGDPGAWPLGVAKLRWAVNSDTPAPHFHPGGVYTRCQVPVVWPHTPHPSTLFCVCYHLYNFKIWNITSIVIYIKEYCLCRPFMDIEYILYWTSCVFLLSQLLSYCLVLILLSPVYLFCQLFYGASFTIPIFLWQKNWL